MPYNKDHPPDWLKNLPAGVQDIGIAVFNKVFAETADEEQARMAAWAAIKAKYKKEGDGWVEMKNIVEMKEQTLTLIMGINPGAPDEFIIFSLGQVTGSDMEPFTVTEKSVASVKAAHQAKGNDTVIDYEHQTLTGGIAPAAGWVNVECIRFSDALDDWNDLTASDIVVSDANTDRSCSPVYQGPTDAASETTGNSSANIITQTVQIGAGGVLATNSAPQTNGGFQATDSALTCYRFPGNKLQ